MRKRKGEPPPLDTRSWNGDARRHAQIKVTASLFDHFYAQSQSHRAGTHVQWSVNAVCLTWNLLKGQMSRVFAPPNQAYCVRSRFLTPWQEKKKLLDDVRGSTSLLLLCSYIICWRRPRWSFFGKGSEMSYQVGSPSCPFFDFQRDSESSVKRWVQLQRSSIWRSVGYLELSC